MDYEDSSIRLSRTIHAPELQNLQCMNFNDGHECDLPCCAQVPGPGQLFKALSVFALREVDMTKIESRPMPFGLAAAVGPEESAAEAKSWHRFDYLFYVDLVGGLGDHVIQNALRHLQVCSQVWTGPHTENRTQAQGRGQAECRAELVSKPARLWSFAH